MRQPRASFHIRAVKDQTVFLVDNDGPLSITNDAEAVYDWAKQNYPLMSNLRLVYCDTMGNWGEITLDKYGLAVFNRYDGSIP